MPFSSAVAITLGVSTSLALLPAAAGRLSATSSQKIPAGTDNVARPKTVHEVLDESMHPEIEPRIIDGAPSALGDFPWYVAPNFGEDLCGASLIHSDVVLTAAHCADVFLVGTNVYVGAFELDSSNGGAVSRTVTAVLPHPDYDDETVENDFLLFKLDSPVTNVTPIELNEDDSSPSANETLTVMGFGVTEEDGWLPSISLRDVDLFAVDHETCRDQYLFIAHIKEDIMFCAGFPGGGKDTCSGDSGGPVISSDGKQVGVVSFGVGCARPEYAGVNARVSGVIGWIKQGVCDLSSSKPSDCAEQPIEEEPDSVPETGSSILRLVVSHDFWVEETTFEFTHKNKTVYEGPKYDPSPFETRNVTLEKFPSGRTTFTILDSACDGLVSGLFEGSFEIYLVNPDGPDVLLAQGDGDFGCSQSVSFDIPEAGEDKEIAEKRRNCKDGSELIDVSDSSRQSCSWLALNKASHGYLCDWHDVAMACPFTCDACEEREISPCQDKAVAVDLGVVAGSKDCGWLAKNMDRFGYTCSLTSVAFHCPVTCKHCNPSSIGT